MDGDVLRAFVRDSTIPASLASVRTREGMLSRILDCTLIVQQCESLTSPLEHGLDDKCSRSNIQHISIEIITLYAKPLVCDAFVSLNPIVDAKPVVIAFFLSCIVWGPTRSLTLLVVFFVG